MGLVCLETYYDLNSAEIARGTLDAAGIPAFVFDRHYIGLAWYMACALGGVRLMVPGDRVAEAAEALRRARASAILEADIDTCPACKSDDVARLYSLWSLAVTVSTFSLVAIPVPVLFSRCRRRCKACGHFWTTA